MHRHAYSIQGIGWPLLLDASNGLLSTCLLKLLWSLPRIVQTQCQSTVLPKIPGLGMSGGAVWAGKNLSVGRFTLCLSLHNPDSADGWVSLCCEVVCLWKMLSIISPSAHQKQQMASPHTLAVTTSKVYRRWQVVLLITLALTKVLHIKQVNSNMPNTNLTNFEVLLA